MAVCRFLEAACRSAPALLTICADVRPGNAGTVIRTTDAAAATAWCSPGTPVDAYNPKTVRATVGSLFPPAGDDRKGTRPKPSARPGRRPHRPRRRRRGEVDLFAADELLAGPTAWLLGNEAWGLPAELAALADHRVRIPILGRAESLNLATAASVCLFASARQNEGVSTTSTCCPMASSSPTPTDG